jgi:hypothetical protein
VRVRRLEGVCHGEWLDEYNHLVGRVPRKVIVASPVDPIEASAVLAAQIIRYDGHERTLNFAAGVQVQELV